MLLLSLPTIVETIVPFSLAQIVVESGSATWYNDN